MTMGNSMMHSNQETFFMNMYDTIEKINGATLLHGQTHDRVYLMQSEEDNWDTVINKIKSIADEKGYSKILGRIPEDAKALFQSKGYTIEAEIPGMFNGHQPGFFISDFPNRERATCDDHKLRTLQSVKTIAFAARKASEDFQLPTQYTIRELDQTDIPVMVDLHSKAFSTYSVPIAEAEFLLKMTTKDFKFFGLFHQNELLISTILKIHAKESNIEIVDFATHPDYKGQNLSYYLVQKIKAYGFENGYKTIYSLARATSYGLNITFSKHGFMLGGTLLNNTVIRGNLESMNVWYLNIDGSSVSGV